MELHHFISKTAQTKIITVTPDENVNYTGLKGKSTQKASCCEMKEQKEKPDEARGLFVNTSCSF